MTNSSQAEPRQRLRIIAAIYFGSFIVWFVVGLIRGGFQWEALLVPVQWMVTGLMALYFPCGLPGIIVDPRKVDLWILTIIGYAIYAVLIFLGIHLKDKTAFRIFAIAFVVIVLLNHVGCHRVSEAVTSRMTLP